MSDEFWKFKLPVPGERIMYSIPLGWVPTLVETGHVWMRVSPDQRHESVELWTVGTGQSFLASWISIGTWLEPPFVWHAIARVAP